MRLIKKITALLLILSALGMVSCKRASEQMVGSPAPDFTLKSIDGRAVSLSSLRGRVVLLEFWATWCPPCRMAAPELSNLYKKYNPKGLEILAISLDENLNDVKTFSEENNIPYPIFVDIFGVSELYRVRSIPVTFLIDKNGIIVSKHNGYSPDMPEELAKKIESLL